MMEHLREWKEIVCWDTTSREPRPKVQFLEMLHYPDRQEPVANEGNLDDSGLSGWLSKVVCLNHTVTQYVPICNRISSYLSFPLKICLHLHWLVKKYKYLVVNGFCKYSIYTDGIPF